MRHVVTLTFENGKTAQIIVDEDHELSVRGLQHIRKAELVSVPR